MSKSKSCCPSRTAADFSGAEVGAGLFCATAFEISKKQVHITAIVQ
jgi:hypothetical protein